MPIVTHKLESTTQANGSSSNVLRLYDQDGREYMQAFFAPSGFNLETKVSLAIAEMDVHLAEQEFQQLLGL